MEWERIEEIWNSETESLGKQRAMDRSAIEAATSRKSKDIIERLRSELLVGLLGLFPIVSLFSYYLVKHLGDPLVVTCSSIVILSSVAVCALFLRQRGRLGKASTVRGSVRQAIEYKIELIQSHFRSAGNLGALFTPIFFIAATLAAEKIDLGKLQPTFGRIMFWGVLSIFFVAVSLGLTKSRTSKLTHEIEACLAHLDDRESPLPRSRSRMTIAHWLLLLLLAGLVVFALIEHVR